MLFFLGCLFSPESATAGDEITFSGSNVQDAPGYVRGKPVTVSHNGGNISIRCVDTDTLSARLPYTLLGFDPATLEAFSKGIGLSVGGDASSGWARSKMPTKPSTINSVEAPLTVTVPGEPSAITVTQTGSGWVEVMNCSGAVKVTSGTGGIYVSGKLTSLTLTAAGGDITVEQAAGMVLTGNSTLSAPAGKILINLDSKQGGKLTAKAAEVVIQPLVMGTNTPSLVSGTLSGTGPTLTLTARDRVEWKSSN
jgi:hypothetical protein